MLRPEKQNRKQRALSSPWLPGFGGTDTFGAGPYLTGFRSPSRRGSDRPRRSVRLSFLPSSPAPSLGSHHNPVGSVHSTTEQYAGLVSIRFSLCSPLRRTGAGGSISVPPPAGFRPNVTDDGVSPTYSPWSLNARVYRDGSSLSIRTIP